jgi:hypothetical protein
MPLRTAALVLTLVLTAAFTIAASCPRPGAVDAADCNDAHQTRTTIARCAADAQTTERCADRATGAEHALDLTRAASEWRKAAMAAGSRTARARRWLAHATVLDERVQDDPGAPLDVRKRAKHDEQLAKAALDRR